MKDAVTIQDGVTELGYVRIGVKDLAAWEAFAAEILALEVVDEGEPGRRYLRMDYWHHRLVVDEDGSDDVLAVGFRVAGPDEFAGMQKRLSDAGVAYEVASAQEASGLKVLELLRTQDPSGCPVEIFHGPLVQYDRPFHPGRGMHGPFVTGAGGMGHCLLGASDAEASGSFYRLLGMRGTLEYRVPLPGGHAFEGYFFHANERDHSIALGPPGERHLNHIMLEYANFDDVGLTYERVRQQGVAVPMAPGKHSNDQMFSFYMATPSGWLVEVGHGGRPATHQSEYYARDVYGHEGSVDG